MKTILFIPDAHAKPGVTNRRFDWLGKFISDVWPDVIVEMGDFFDMESLCSYDGSALTGNNRPIRDFEGRRYQKDLAAGHDAYDRIEKFGGEAFKRARKVKLGGNHDWDRISRVVQKVPELEGTVSHKDISRSWETYPFLEPANVCGYICQHYFTSGVSGRPIFGEDPALTILKKQFSSTVSAHSHLFGEAHRMTASRKKIQSFVVGCYLDPTQREAYAGPANDMWVNGLTLAYGCENGFASDGWSFISTKKLQKTYGES